MEGVLNFVDPEHIDTELAEGLSYIADPTVLVPGGGAAKAATATGRATSRLGKAASAGSEAVTNLATKVTEKLPSTKALNNPIIAGTLGASVGGLPGAGVAASAVQGGKVATKVARVGGDIAGEAGELIAKGPSQLSITERLVRGGNPGVQNAVVSKASAFFEPVARTTGVAARGAAQGAAVGAAIGGATDGTEGALQGLGGGISGGAVGAVGAKAARKVSGAERRAAENNDIAKTRQGQIDNGVDPKLFDDLDRDIQLKLAQAENLVGGNAVIELQTRKDYEVATGHNGSAAYYDSASGKIVLNVQSRDLKQNMLHELGHAVFESPVVDKGAFMFDLERIYGQDGIKMAGAEYSLKMAMNAKEQELRTIKKSPSAQEIKAARDSVTTEDSVAVYNQLTSNDPGYFINEIFAEHFMQESVDQNLNAMRKSRFSPSGLVYGSYRSILGMKRQALGALGVPFDSTGRPALFKLKDDPKLQKQIRQYTRDYDRYLGAGSSARKPQVNLPDKYVFAEGGTSVRKEDGTLQSIAMRQEPDGKVVTKKPSQIKKDVRHMASEVKAVIPEDTLLDSSNATVGRRLSESGREIISGKRLPDSIKDLPSMENLRGAAEALESAIADGRSLQSWMAVVGTGDRWRVNVRKNLGNIPAQQYSYLPYEFQVTKAGHISAKAIDWDHVRGKVDSWKRKGQLRIWGNDTEAFRQDVYKYFRNHQAGRPGGTGLPDDKKNAINAFYNLNNDSSNAWSKAFNKGDKRIYKDIRLDRVLNTENGPDKGHFFDFGKVKQNFSPER